MTATDSEACRSKPASVVIEGTGSYAPARVLTNEDLAHMVETSDEWIVTRTGIRSRHIAAEGEYTSDMAAEAARRAISDAGIEARDVDMVIVATISPDMVFPSTACFVQTKLGLRNVPAFDVSAACSGFLYGLEVASALLRSGTYKHILVIGAEKLSAITNWKDRTTCVLFGDGAGAVVLGTSQEPGVGILDSVTGADGASYDILMLPAGGSAKPASVETVQAGEHYIQMQGNQVFKIAVRAMEQCANEVLQRQGVASEQLRWVIPHQANTRIIEAISQRLGVGMERFRVNVDSYGNTSSASIPIALDEACRSGSVKKGDHLLLVSFGAGLTWASTLIKWH